MEAQQAQALDALQKLSQLEQAMEPAQSIGNSDGQVPEVVVGQSEVCKLADILYFHSRPLTCVLSRASTIGTSVIRKACKIDSKSSLKDPMLNHGGELR